MHTSSTTRFIVMCAGAALVTGLFGCDSKTEVPETWEAIGVPLGDGELRRKEEQSAERVSIDHDGILETRKVCMRYREALEVSGMADDPGPRDRDGQDYIVRTLDDGGESVLLRCVNAMDKTVVIIEYDARELGPRRALAGE